MPLRSREATASDAPSAGVPPRGRLVNAYESRDTGEPSGHLVRMVTMLLQLLRSHSIDYPWYGRHFELSKRQFARDLQHMRKIVEELGLKIPIRKDGRFVLIGGESWNKLGDRPRDQADALLAVARALGGPAAHELGAEPAEDERADRFLLFALPRLIADSAASKVFDALKAAHAAGARVQFRYRDPYGKETSRVVEPYRAVARAGRYYLIGYDTQRKGWRYFAIDRIVAAPARSGSYTPRAIPPAYLSRDAIGMLQSGDATTNVRIRLSPVIAQSIVSRRWQRAQRVKHLPDGSADITFAVADVNEAVRWALSFGAEARVVAPPAAVAAARRTIDQMHGQYVPAKPAKRKPALQKR